MRREFLMLAKKYVDQRVGGWYVSEKLDGQRCFWDGGYTRGTPKHEIAWANHDKDARLLTRPVCTGLWSRYGNVIHAPDWWLDQLPVGCCLDGELMAEDRQTLRSIVSRQVAGSGWEQVKYHVFATPTLGDILVDGVIKGVNFNKVFSGYDVGLIRSGKFVVPSDDVDVVVNDVVDVVLPVDMQVLPSAADAASAMIQRLLEEVTERGGEGLMLRHPWWPYQVRRSDKLLKVKKLDDMEGRVVGYTAGKGKLLGLMGALILDIGGGRVLELSGFTDAERALPSDVSSWAASHPGETLPDWAESRMFPRGTTVTFRYRGMSRDRIPQEARYWRTRNV